MPIQKLLIFGHSHIWSIKRALESNVYIPSDPKISFKVILCGTQKFPGTLICNGLTGSEYINPALMSALSDYPAPIKGSDENTWLISGVQGNYYNTVGMLDDGDPFDFVVPGYESLPLRTESKILPYHAVVEAINAQIVELTAFYKRLVRFKYSGVIHLGAPPPNPSSEMIFKQLDGDPKLSGRLISVSNSMTRLKLWITQELLLRKHCETLGIHYLTAPNASTDPEGFLKAHLCKDAVHGTTEYSGMVLQDIEYKISTICAGALV